MLLPDVCVMSPVHQFASSWRSDPDKRRSPADWERHNVQTAGETRPLRRASLAPVRTSLSIGGCSRDPRRSVSKRISLLRRPGIVAGVQAGHFIILSSSASLFNCTDRFLCRLSTGCRCLLTPVNSRD